MPELPEVETTRRGIAGSVIGQCIAEVIVRNPMLRWPVPRDLERSLAGARVHAVERRAKYLLLRIGDGTLIIHLGMSGSLKLVDPDALPETHDHLDIVLDDRHALRLRDPRRFGAVLWTTRDPAQHPLLCRLGPEPLGEEFDGGYLHERSRGRRRAVKNFVMDSRVVAGVGNIYANEALHLAGIHPARPAGRISRARHEQLAGAIRTTLSAAIGSGGTTLRDFVGSAGEPGAFGEKLHVYGRAGLRCGQCAGLIRSRSIGQRSSFYCPVCQR